MFEEEFENEWWDNIVEKCKLDEELNKLPVATVPKIIDKLIESFEFPTKEDKNAHPFHD